MKRVLLVLALMVAVRAPARAQVARMSHDSTIGVTLKYHRLALGIGQDSLSKLTSRTVSRTRISEIERAVRPISEAQADSLFLALRRAAYARMDSSALRYYNLVERRNRSRP